MEWRGRGSRRVERRERKVDNRTWERELKGLIGDEKGQRSGDMTEEQGVGKRREDGRKGKSEEKRGGRGDKEGCMK